MSKYVYSRDDAFKNSKFGMDIEVYKFANNDVSFCRASVKEGHLEEFKNSSWFLYYIIEGSGVFMLNDKKHPVKDGDLVAVPPNTRIHYFGKMDYTLTINPPWKEENETHIRDISPSENPLKEVD